MNGLLTTEVCEMPVQQEFNWVAAGEAKPAAGKLCPCLENQVPFLFLPEVFGISIFWFDYTFKV